MSDDDRGPYTPPTDRLAFDPREPVRGGGPAPVTLIVSGVVLLAIIGGVFLLYRGGVRHRGETPSAVGAPIAQIKTPAAPDANSAAPRLVIDRSDAGATNETPLFAPSAEQPLPRPQPMPPQPVASSPLPPPAEAPASNPPPPPPTFASAQPPPPAAKPAPSIASLTDAALAQKAGAKPAPKPPPAPKPALAPRPAASQPAVSAPAATPPAGAGWVQIGAYSSAALAQKGWSDTARLEPAGMAGKGQRIEAVEVGGKTLYRAYVTGFSHDGAEAFCGKLKAAGKACLVK